VYLLYSLATFVFFIVASPYFAYQAIFHKKYFGSLAQRLGYLPVSLNLDRDESIWVHAVSVGEVLTARPLITDLRRYYPHLKILLSTTTLTGQQLARRDVRDVDGVFYFPFDWAFAVRRTLDVVRPKLFLMVETEIWPNLLRECRRRGVKTVLVNGRVSFRSYPRYRLVRSLFKHVLKDIDLFCVQDDEAAQRLLALGASPDHLQLTGSLKFDALDASLTKGRGRVLRFFRMSSNRQVIIAGSTLKGEEKAVVRAFNRIRSGGSSALLVLAPRHPERFDHVERLCRHEGLAVVRRSNLPIDSEPRADAVVLDTVGELAELYQIATVVFVGGSLSSWGGHNILEPAVFGRPIIFGPFMQNFSEIAETFLRNEAAVQVQNEHEFTEAVVNLMADPVYRARLGAGARALVEANRGAKDKTIEAITSSFPARGAVVRAFRVVR